MVILVSMNNVIIADDTGLATEGETLRAVIAYGGIEAGKRAMQLLGGIANGLGTGEDLHPVPWSFNLLREGEWREAAAYDAVRADVLVIAAGEKLPSDIADWVLEVIDQKRGMSGAVVLLEYGSGHLDWSEIEGHALRAGLACFTAHDVPTSRNPSDMFEGSEWEACCRQEAC